MHFLCDKIEKNTLYRYENIQKNCQLTAHSLLFTTQQRFWKQEARELMVAVSDH